MLSPIGCEPQGTARVTGERLGGAYGELVREFASAATTLDAEASALQAAQWVASADAEPELRAVAARR